MVKTNEKKKEFAADVDISKSIRAAPGESERPPTPKPRDPKND